MTTNQQRAAQVIGQAYEQAMDSMVPSAWKGHIARALAEHEPPLLMPDVDPERVHDGGSITVIETGSERTAVITWRGIVTLVDEVAGDLAAHNPERAAENAMTIDEVDGLIAALVHARNIAATYTEKEAG